MILNFMKRTGIIISEWIFILFFLLLQPSALCQEIITGGIVSGTWKADHSPYMVFGDITIPDDSSLTIEPGVNVVFYGPFGISVPGRLIAIGSSADSIFFSINDTTGFSDTTSNHGGWHGIRILNTDPADTSVIRYCDLSYGKATGGGVEAGKGGAINISGNANVIIEHSTLHNNLGTEAGGAICCSPGSSAVIRNNRLMHNKTYHEGGGIYAGEGCKLLIESNTIAFNIAYFIIYDGGLVIRGGAGGGIYITDPFSFQTGVIIINNFLFNNLSHNGGGIYESCKEVLISGNAVSNNSRNGIMNGHMMGKGRYFNNTICNNSPYAGIAVCSRSLRIENNIIWGNENWESPGSQIYRINEGQMPEVFYSDIQNGYPGEGNMDEIPEFADPSEGAGISFNSFGADWSLKNNSPCINKGKPDTAGMVLPAADIAGNPRIYGNRIEMGAFENQYVASSTLSMHPDSGTVYIMPNPCADYFSILFNEENEQTGKLSIYNSCGKPVLESDIVSRKQNRLYIGDLPDGIYFGTGRFKSKVYRFLIVKNR